ncbi:hypothetical protein ACVIW0_004465 [Bradyrhizobium sp. USDA 4454]
MSIVTLIFDGAAPSAAPSEARTNLPNIGLFGSRLI